jgi:hypothetical protein
MLEFTWLNNYGGKGDSRNAAFIVANLPFFYGGWNFGCSFSGKLEFELVDKFKSGNNILLQANIGYRLINGISIDISRKYEKSVSFENREESDLSSWGIGLSYSLKF